MEVVILYIYLISLLAAICILLISTKIQRYKRWREARDDIKLYNEEFEYFLDAELMPHVREFSNILEPYGFHVQNFNLHIAPKLSSSLSTVDLILEREQFGLRHKGVDYSCVDNTIYIENLAFVLGKSRAYFGKKTYFNTSATVNSTIVISSLIIELNGELGGDIRVKFGKDYDKKYTEFFTKHFWADDWADIKKKELYKII